VANRYYEEGGDKLKLRHIVVLLVLVSIILAVGCSTLGKPANTPDNTAIIVDRAGREWNVTYARDVYGMNPDYYNYGLGVGAIPSVDEPTILEEGDQGYPEPASLIGVVGVNHNGERRAYSVSDLTRHEVFNDKYPGESEQYVAVAY